MIYVDASLSPAITAIRTRIRRPICVWGEPLERGVGLTKREAQQVVCLLEAALDLYRDDNESRVIRGDRSAALFHEIAVLDQMFEEGA